MSEQQKKTKKEEAAAAKALKALAATAAKDEETKALLVVGKALKATENVLLKAIADGQKAFITGGIALRTIRDDDLYLADGFASFRSWIDGRANDFGMSRSHAYRWIQASDTFNILPEPPKDDQWSESMVRAFDPIRKDERAVKRIAGKIVKDVEAGKDHLTASLVETRVEAHAGKVREAKPKADKQTSNGKPEAETAEALEGDSTTDYLIWIARESALTVLCLNESPDLAEVASASPDLITEAVSQLRALIETLENAIPVPKVVQNTAVIAA